MQHAYLTRRGVLRALVYLSACGLWRPARGLAKMVPSSAPDPLATKLAQFFVHKDSAASVGLAYLRTVPAEADTARLVALLCGDIAERRAAIADADRDTLRELLLQQQRQDFEDGHIVMVDGWILSETEARLCALATLT